MKSRIKMILGNNLFFVCVVIFFPVFFIFQCGDLTDAGFFANEYYFFNDNISSNSIKSQIFLTSFLGNFWINLTPNEELISLKILFLLFTYLLVFCSFQIAKQSQLPNWLLNLAILSGLFFATRATNFIFDYDIASYTMLVCAVLFISKGIKEDRYLSFFISGILIGLATLFRFPSLIAIVPFAIITLISNRESSISIIHFRYMKWKYASTLFLGFSILIASFIVILQILQIEKAYYSGFSAISKSIGGQDNTSYGIFKLLYKYLSDCIKFLPHLITGLLILFASKFVFVKKYLTTLFTIALSVVIFLFYKFDSLHSYESNIKYLPLILFVFIIITSKDTWKSSTLLLIFTVLLSQVAGSNTGLFLKMSFGMIAFIPILIGSFYNSENKWLSKDDLALFSSIQLSLIVIFSLICRWAWVYHVDDSFTSRFSMTKTLNPKKLSGIYTNPQRAQQINNVMIYINEDSLKNKDLLVTNNEVLYYYLSNKLPVTSDCWLSNYQNQKGILSDIKKNKKHHKLVVLEDANRIKNNTIDSLIIELKQDYQFKTIYKNSKHIISEAIY